MRRAAPLVASAVLVAAPFLAIGPAAGSGHQMARDALERARAAAREERFSGEIQVAWRFGATWRRALVEVHGGDGQIRLGDDVVAGEGGRRMVRSAGEWLMLWRDEAFEHVPPPAEKYSFAMEAGPAVAGRITEVLVVRLEGSPTPRERLYLDRKSGLLLRRELLDARGRAHRSVGFTRIEPADRKDPTEPSTSGREPVPAGNVHGPYEAPGELGDGYVLIGRYENRHSDLVHLYYSDGLHNLSVFEQRGRLAEGDMAPGGQHVEAGGHPVLAYATSAGDAAVWEGDGVVYTVVGDGTFDDVAAVVGDLSHGKRPGRLRRLAELVASVFRLR